MATAPYSVRFMSGTAAAGTTETFTVPEGKRASVRAVAITNFGASAASVYMYIHGIPCWGIPSLAPQSPQNVTCRWTAYERETVKLVCTGVNIAYSVDGYLFIDPDGRPDDADNTHGTFDVTTPLPAYWPEVDAGGPLA